MEQKILRRSSKNRWIAGVIGGVGEYLDIAPDRLRLTFVLLSLIVAGFPGIVLYLTLWFLVPKDGE